MNDEKFRWTDGVATAKLRAALALVENERRSWVERAERIEALQMAERLDPLSSRHEEREYAEGVQFGLDLAARLLRESAETLPLRWRSARGEAPDGDAVSGHRIPRRVPRSNCR